MYNTKIKGLSFKFHFDTKTALVALDIEGDLEIRIKYWEKLLALKSILINDYLPNAVFEEDYVLDNGKEISRIYVKFENKVSIHNKNMVVDDGLPSSTTSISIHREAGRPTHAPGVERSYSSTWRRLYPSGCAASRWSRGRKRNVTAGMQKPLHRNNYPMHLSRNLR